MNYELVKLISSNSSDSIHSSKEPKLDKQKLYLANPYICHHLREYSLCPKKNVMFDAVKLY